MSPKPVASGRILDPPNDMAFPVSTPTCDAEFWFRRPKCRIWSANGRTGEFIAILLVRPKQEANFTSTNANVPGWNIGVLADVAGKLEHKCIAKPADLVVGFALWIKVGASLFVHPCVNINTCTMMQG